MSNSAVGMPCPVCKIPLVMSERQGVEIDYCPQCRGIWLDRGELDKILERSAADAPAPVPAPQPTYQPQASSQMPTSGYDNRDYRSDKYGYPHHKRKKSFLHELFD